MTLQELQSQVPPEWPESLQEGNREALLKSQVTLVVLDDDPTGTQTVHDVPVLTRWDEPLLEKALKEGHPLIFLLTNSRSLTEEETAKLHKGIAQDLSKASQKSGRVVELISRSDSTLRGHFPLETDVLAENWHVEHDLTLVMPFFFEGGRLTANGQHYVQEGESLVPAHETPFAQDAVFSFRNSSLPEWIEEKSEGSVKSVEVVSVSLQAIREGGPNEVLSTLKSAAPGSVVALDAMTDCDAEVVAAGVAAYQAGGGRLMARTAASYVRARAGLPKRALLTSDDLRGEGKGGLVVVGSHVPKTTAQLGELLKRFPDLVQVELSVRDALENTEQAVAKVTNEVNAALAEDHEVVIFTSRELVKVEDAGGNLSISATISGCLVSVMQSLAERPRFVVAKGGITSSDLATEGLSVQEATVAGSILPGVPVWRLGSEARYPGLHYVIFPGNVGGDGALAEAVAKLSKS